MTVHESHERRRACGFRKPGGLYLVADPPQGECGKLPLALSLCPVCGSGYRPARGCTWVNAALMFSRQRCERHLSACLDCRLSQEALLEQPRMGLQWVGSIYYPTPAAFLEEAQAMGISRRIARLPRGFRLGEDWLLLAHLKAIPAAEGPEPGAFCCFKPKALEYVVRPEDSTERLEALEARGIRLVRVVPIKEQPELFQEEAANG